MPWPTLVVLALLLSTAAAAAGPGGTPEVVTLEGKAVLLADALKSTGVAFDRDPVARQVVLKGDDGTLTPILSDDASRALFTDERLRDRRTEVSGRLFRGVPYLQVVSFKVEEGGEMRTPEYYCEICTISVRFPQICPCCQGEMVLRMRPDRR